MAGAYEKAGVSLARGDLASKEARQLIQRTYQDNYVRIAEGIPGIDMLKAIEGFTSPRLITAMDGVGTKLVYAAVAQRFDTVPEDLVAMILDDLSRYNVFPITFGMYRGANEVQAAPMRLMIQGAVNGCIKGGMVAYTSGETAEMPGFYNGSNFELVGFACGLVEGDNLRRGQDTQEGDVLVALHSYGGGSNGFSLYRRTWPPEDVVAGKCSVTIDEILKPTPIYTKPVLVANREFPSIRGWAHITGGGLGCDGKLPDIVPEGLAAELDMQTWEIPTIFHKIREEAELSFEDWVEVYNLGLMMVAPVARTDASSILRLFDSLGYQASVVGRVVEQTGKERVVFKGR